MIYTITAHMVVNVDDEQYPEHQDAVVTDGLNELFRDVQYRVEKSDDEPFIVDWAYEQHPANPGERNVVARPDLNLATYQEGDAFDDTHEPEC
jgi:hypothetical protein